MVALLNTTGGTHSTTIIRARRRGVAPAALKGLRCAPIPQASSGTRRIMALVRVAAGLPGGFRRARIGPFGLRGEHARGRCHGLRPGQDPLPPPCSIPRYPTCPTSQTAGGTIQISPHLPFPLAGLLMAAPTVSSHVGSQPLNRWGQAAVGKAGFEVWVLTKGGQVSVHHRRLYRTVVHAHLVGSYDEP